MPLALFAMTAFCGQAAAQGAFPAPLPNQSSQSNSSASPFPPVNQSGTAATSSSSPFPNPSPTSTAASQGVFSQGATPLGGGLAAGGMATAPQPGGGTAEQEE